MEVGEGLGAPLVVFDEPAEAGSPCEGSLDNRSSGQEHEAALGLRQLDDLERDAMFSGRCGGLFSCIALVDKSDLDVLAGFRLNGLGDAADLGAIVSVCGRDMQGQKMAKGVDGEMQFRSLLAFGAVISRASAAFRRRAQGPAVDDGGSGLGGSPRRG